MNEFESSYHRLINFNGDDKNDYIVTLYKENDEKNSSSFGQFYSISIKEAIDRLADCLAKNRIASLTGEKKIQTFLYYKGALVIDCGSYCKSSDFVKYFKARNHSLFEDLTNLNKNFDSDFLRH